MAKRKKSISEYDTVMVIHKKCGGWLFWAVDMPGCKREIKDALYRASKDGSEVRRIRIPATFAYAAAPGCRCSLPGGER